MCARRFARTHRVFKLWKNPNGLNNDARWCPTHARIAHISINKVQQKTDATLKRDRIVQCESWNAVTYQALKAMTVGALADGVRFDQP